MRVQISQARACQKIRFFLTLYLHIFQLANIQHFTRDASLSVLPESRDTPAVRPLRLCNGAAIALQRARRCTLTRAPLHPREGLTARECTLFQTKTSIKNQPKSSLLKGREAPTGTKRVVDTRFCARKSNSESPKEALTGCANDNKQMFLCT